MNDPIRFTVIATPLGLLRLAARDGGLVGAHFPGQRHEPAQGSDWHRDPAMPLLQRAAAEIADYFAGGRRGFTAPLAPEGTAFQRAVWAAIAAVPRGETITYAELARRVGRPAAVRAAGAATGRNPLSIVIPCHRIVGAGGALTGYAGGLDRKRALLDLECGEAGGRRVGARARQAA